MENIKKINMSEIGSIKDSLDSKSLKVCVIGIGRIGLPTALSFANAGLKTIGVDINQNLIDMINNRDFPLKDEVGYEDIFHNVIENGTFSVTTNAKSAVETSDLILLSLPTPMNEKNIPYYDALQSVGKNLSETLQPNSLVIVESTIEPGFIENELINLIESSGRLKIKKDFAIGVCPENANPGQILHDFTNLPRLVGGIDENTRDIIKMIYNYVFNVELIPMPNCKTANAVKLTTNVFRDINIAFISELSLLFEKLGIDTLTVLEAAKKKYNFQIHYPGSGVGGPCLPINSYQFLNTGKRVGMNLDIINTCRKINEQMPQHVVDLTLNAFNECNLPIENSNILILGISYKPDVKDIQLTPAEEIIKKFQRKGAKVHLYDPYFSSMDVFGLKVNPDIEQIISDVDACVIVTGHNEFKKIPITTFKKMKNPILIDTRGIIKPIDAKNNALVFRGLGRGTS